MKYGDTLRQRSIPEWGHFNIDYDYLKDLIKHQTTPGAGRAVSIPGQGGTSERTFGDTFYKVLKAQHHRINLFIKSKSGEIERRLDHVGRSLEHLKDRKNIEGANGRLPARIMEKYAKIDADVTRAGEEIRSLSRFQIAQRTGFRKILKKYRRWTNDTELERAFAENVTDHPDSFFRTDLGYLLDELIDVLAALRAPFEGSGAATSSNDRGATSSPTSRISSALRTGDEVDLDIALSMTPLGSRGSRATYWVHPENIVEVQILLLQHMRLFTGSSGTSTPASKEDETPKRRKSSLTTDKYLGSEDKLGLLIVDHPEAFAIKQNANTIGSSEETTGSKQAKAAGNARWTTSSDAVISVGIEPDQDVRASEAILTAKLKREFLPDLLDLSKGTHHGLSTITAQQAGHKDDTASHITSVQDWLTAHPDKRPIAGVVSTRNRFVGLHNNATGGVWAVFDRGILLQDALNEHLHNDDWASEALTGAKEFPHAVLEIRREGSGSNSLIQLLDRSHLVERVRGFSLEVHAVWACCKPSAMAAPFWISLLDNDIRKLPAPVKRQRRKGSSSVNGVLSVTSPRETSTSATSITDGQHSPCTLRNGESSMTSAPELEEPLPLQAFRKKSRKARSEGRATPQLEQVNEGQRYWNEYDNPESGDEGYYIYIDPNASVKFPGQEWLESWSARTKRLFGIRDVTEQESLLSDDSSGDETADESVIGTRPRNYGTIASQGNEPQHKGYFSSIFRSFRDPHRDAETLNAMRRQSELERRSLISEIELRQHKAEMTKFRFYSTCIITAIVMDVILGMMTVTSRRKERGVVDSVVLFGTICNLILCVVGIISMKTRRERLGWMHQGMVLGLVCGNVVVDVLLFRWVLSGL